MLDEYIDNVKENIIKTTCELIKIPSVYKDSENLKEPFGKNTAKALEYALELGENLGFRVKNIDGYCGYIEFGEGEDLVGIIGHLDVVPEGENWTYPPFSAQIKDNKIYGRGAIDDKGPVVAALYAMKAVMDTCKVQKRVRLILGINEERDWKCIQYYKQHEEIPSIGFSPDADFPCIYAEKALLNVFISQKYFQGNDNIIIEKIDCANNAINVVPKICVVTLKINNKDLSINDLLENLAKNISKYNYDIDIKIIDELTIELTSHGISAHAAHPDFGKNAISPMIELLYNILSLYNANIDILKYFISKIGNQYNGEKLKINYNDESGNLTLNTAQFDLINGELKLGLNLRIPVTIPIEIIKEKFENSNLYDSISISFSGEKDALYIQKNDKLVSILCNIFNEKTGLHEEPIAIGGATYARAFPNCISYGATMPGCKDLCHQVDEYISIDNLILSSKIYAQAIYELAN